jgi:hypothetical protein
MREHRRCVPSTNRSFPEARPRRALPEQAPHPVTRTTTRTRPGETAATSEAISSGVEVGGAAAYRIPPSRKLRKSGSE